MIDLIFTSPDVTFSYPPRRELLLQGPSDHVPLAQLLPISDAEIRISWKTIPRESEEESKCLVDMASVIKGLACAGLDSIQKIDDVALAMLLGLTAAWDSHAVEWTITSRSSPWWDQSCLAALSAYRSSRGPEVWHSFRKAVKAAKHRFFDAKIEEIASLNQRP